VEDEIRSQEDNSITIEDFLAGEVMIVVHEISGIERRDWVSLSLSVVSSSVPSAATSVLCLEFSVESRSNVRRMTRRTRKLPQPTKEIPNPLLQR